jgi:hypothetical protein
MLMLGVGNWLFDEQSAYLLCSQNKIVHKRALLPNICVEPNISKTGITAVTWDKRTKETSK